MVKIAFITDLTDIVEDYADLARTPQGILEKGEASRWHDIPILCSLCSYFEATHGDLRQECDAFIDKATRDWIWKTYTSCHPGETSADPIIISDDDDWWYRVIREGLYICTKVVCKTWADVRIGLLTVGDILGRISLLTVRDILGTKPICKISSMASCTSHVRYCACIKGLVRNMIVMN